MRDIKFRGRHIISKKWIIGDLIHEEWIGGKAIMIKRKKTAHSVLEETVGQFTGLHDKNGKEIYESDIVEVTRQCIWEKGIIVFIDGCFFIKVNETLLALYECEPNNYELKVIGNIYENSDLLKGADNIE